MQVRGEGVEEKLRKVIWGENLERNQTQKRIHSGSINSLCWNNVHYEQVVYKSPGMRWLMITRLCEKQLMTSTCRQVSSVRISEGCDWVKRKDFLHLVFFITHKLKPVKLQKTVVFALRYLRLERCMPCSLCDICVRAHAHMISAE